MAPTNDYTISITNLRDAYRNDEEKELMYAWNLTGRTIMHVDQWIQFFKKVGYTGDYYWFIP